jgi:hypothetical protein
VRNENEIVDYVPVQEALDHLTDKHGLVNEVLARCKMRESVGVRPPKPEVVLLAARIALSSYLSKNPTYNDSWCRAGARGALDNVARKFDRLDKMVLKTPGEGRIDDGVDLGAYSIMHLAHLLENRPEEALAVLQHEGLA